MLKAAKFGSIDYKTVFDGTNLPTQTQFTYKGLIPGSKYTFIVISINFNGQSAPSSAFTFNVCTPPKNLAQPTRMDLLSTTNQLTISWKPPMDDGGCPITGYAVWRDDGTGAQIFTEVNTQSDPAIRNIPTLSQATITNFPADSEGIIF